MGLKVTVTQSKSNFQPIKITTPQGDELILHIYHCGRRNNSIVCDVQGDRDMFQVDRLPKIKNLHDKDHYRAKKKKQQLSRLAQALNE